MLQHHPSEGVQGLPGGQKKHIEQEHPEHQEAGSQLDTRKELLVVVFYRPPAAEGVNRPCSGEQHRQAQRVSHGQSPQTSLQDQKSKVSPPVS